MQSYNNSTTNIFKNYLISCAISVVVSLGVAAIFAMLMTFFSISNGYSAIFSTLSYIIGCFTGSAFFGKINKSKGLVFGTAIGATVFVISLIIALIVNKSSLSLITLFHLLGCLLSGAIGGIISVNKSAKNKYLKGKFK